MINSPDLSLGPFPGNTINNQTAHCYMSCMGSLFSVTNYNSIVFNYYCTNYYNSMCMLVYLPVSRILPLSIFSPYFMSHILPFFKLLPTSGKTVWDCLTIETAPSSHRTRNHFTALAIKVLWSSTESVNFFFYLTVEFLSLQFAKTSFSLFLSPLFLTSTLDRTCAQWTLKFRSTDK